MSTEGEKHAVRTPYIKYKTYCNPLTQSLVVPKRGGGERIIPKGKWWINKNTPPGEDAEFWERMPHDGRRIINSNKIIATLE